MIPGAPRLETGIARPDKQGDADQGHNQRRNPVRPFFVITKHRLFLRRYILLRIFHYTFTIDFDACQGVGAIIFILLKKLAIRLHLSDLMGILL